MLEGRDIVCLSQQYWDERWFRKQEFMSRLLEHNRVLYVEPSFSMVRPPERHLSGIATNRLLRARVEDRGGNLHLLKPPRGLPRWNDPRVDRVTYRWYGQLIARALRRLGFRDVLLWVYYPSYFQALDAIPHRQLVFDLTDDISAFVGDWEARRAYVDGCVSGLVARSDLLIVTALTLAERYERLASRVEHVGNGFDAELFSPERAAAAFPPALTGIQRPMLGFVGTLFPFIDYELLEQVARRHRDKSLVMVGPVEATVRESVERLAALPNVHYLGPQPKRDIPALVAAFDVCLNPFREGPVARSVNPLKVYEYLALGRPVVSTPMEALEREPVAAGIAFARGADGFCAEIERSLGETVQAAAPDRIELVSGYSWSRLFERLDAVCADALGSPAAVSG